MAAPGRRRDRAAQDRENYESARHLIRPYYDPARRFRARGPAGTRIGGHPLLEDAMPFRALLVAVVLVASPSVAAAQALMRPEPAPTRVAGNEPWYRAGEPVLYRGEAFYPAGAHVFFNGNVMVLIGQFRGVPIYADPTIETGSIVYLPIGGGMMQPYEKLRAGELAGTSGSRTPSFPPAAATSLEPDPQVAGTTGVMIPP